MLRILSIVVMTTLALAGCRGKTRHPLNECLTAFVCAAGCQSDGCLQACVDAAGEEAQERMNALASCAAEHGCEQADDTACLKASCPTELDACMR